MNICYCQLSMKPALVLVFGASLAAMAVAYWLIRWVLAKDTGTALTLEALEQKVIEAAVDHAGGNLAAAARLLGLSRAQLAYRLQKY